MTNEFKIISEDGLKTLCKAIKKTSTIGEIIDDDNSVTDKTYSSFKIDERLNTKIDKTQLTTVLDETVTDEQIPGAKVVVDELNTKANDSEVVKKTDIATTIDGNSTDDEIVSAKLAYTNFIRGKSARQSYLDEIGTNDVLQFPEGKYTISESVTYANLPVGIKAGYLEIWNMNGGSHETPFNSIWKYRVVKLQDYNTKKSYYRVLRSGESGVFLDTGWQRLCTTTVADVSKTVYSLDTSCDGVYKKGDTNTDNCWYAIRNGWCIVQIDLKCLQVGAGFKHVFTSLPKPIASIANVIITNDKKIDVGDKPLIVIIGTDGSMKVEGGKLDGRYIGTFSYPVAE